MMKKSWFFNKAQLQFFSNMTKFLKQSETGNKWQMFPAKLFLDKMTAISTVWWKIVTKMLTFCPFVHPLMSLIRAPQNNYSQLVIQFWLANFITMINWEKLLDYLSNHR